MGARGAQPKDIKMSGMASAHPAPPVDGQPPAVVARMVHVGGIAALQYKVDATRFGQVLLTWPDLALLLRQVRLPGHGLGVEDLAALLRVEALLRGENTNGEEQ